MEQEADGGTPENPTARLERNAEWHQDGPPSEAMKTLHCRTVAIGGLQLRHHVRDLDPIERGAGLAGRGSLRVEETEPDASEMLLLALSTCVTVSIQANAVARRIPISSLEIYARGDVDPSSLWGTGPRCVKPLGFQSISITVEIEADVPREALQSLVDHAVLWSPVANTLHDPVDLHVEVSSR